MEIKRVEASQTWALRQAVMWPDKPLAYVQLADDDLGWHYGLFEGPELISVVSIFRQGQEAQFRKFATAAHRQGQGYGSKLLGFVMEEARNCQVSRIWCNARADKCAFYEKFGLEKTGEVFSRGGLAYVTMSRQLA
jgi:predicted GNAT family N-acyltransferase